MEKMVKPSENNDNEGQYPILDAEDTENEDSSSGTDDQVENTENDNEHLDLIMAKVLLKSIDFDKLTTQVENLQDLVDLTKNLDEGSEEYNIINAEYEASVKELQDALSVEWNLLNLIGCFLTEFENHLY